MIGLFDSGIGGLTVVRAVQRLLPDYACLYFGDTARTPYGNKSPDVVTKYGLQAARFLIERGAKVLVVACNTVSAVGVEAIKQTWPDLPVFEVISPVINKISQTAGLKLVGVMGTRATVNSGVYQSQLKQFKVRVVAAPAPLLVPLVEENWLTKPETKRIVKNYLQPFKQSQVQALILACTHYPLLKGLIEQRLGKRIKIIDPAEETAQALQRWLVDHPEFDQQLSRAASHYYVSDLTMHFKAVAEKWLGRKITLEQVDIE